MIWVPGTALPGPVLVKATSALTNKVVTRIETLFPGVGSTVAVATVALLVTFPVAPASTSTVRVYTRFVPVVSVPIVGQVTTCPTTEAGDGVADEYVIPTGSVSASTTADASLGPLFVTVIV